jgi:tRNA nucleotidyltransferase/poly(A) polymerase
LKKEGFWPKDIPFIQKLFDLSDQQGWILHFVGGSVRDFLSGRLKENIKDLDIDIVINQSIEDVIPILKQYTHVIPTGLKHGTVTLFDEESGVKVELTSQRKDVICDGRRSEIIFTHSLEEDAKRRDFTINALYINKYGELIDFFNGYDDLKNQHVRFIGDAKTRIIEDHLRILRYFRFLAYFENPHFHVDEFKNVIVCKDLLKKISKERITQELLKIISYPNFAKSLTFLRDYKIFDTLNLSPCSVDDAFCLPKEIDLKNESILCLLGDRDILKKQLSLSKLTLKKIYLTQTITSIQEAYLELGFNGALVFAWYQYCYLKYPFEQSFDKLYHLNKMHPSPKLPINAQNIIEIFHLKDKEIGIVLKRTKNFWIQSNFETTKEECLNFISFIIGDIR